MTVFEKGLITIIAVAVVFAGLAIPLMADAHFARGLLAASIVSAIAIGVLYRTQLDARVFLDLSVVMLVVPSALATLATVRYIRHNHEIL